MKLTLPIALITLIQTAFAQTITYHWDTESQVTGFPYETNATTPSVQQYSSSGGLNGSGAFQFSGGNGSSEGMMTTPDDAVTFDLTSDQSITQSTYFQVGTRTQFGANGRRPLYLGLTSENTVTFNPSTGGGPAVKATGAGLRVVNYNDPSGFVDATFGFISGTSGGNGAGGFSDNGGSFQLVHGNWYFMEVTLNYTAGAGSWLPSVTITNSDSAGILGSEVASSSFGGGSAYFDTWSGDTDLRGYISSWGGERSNISNIDQTTLVAIPEPSSIALLSIAIALGLAASRRKR